MTMLDRMRRHRGWLKWSLGLVAAAMAVFLVPTDFLAPTATTVGASPRETIADVGGRAITAGDFQLRYLSQIQAYRNQFGGNVNDQLLRQLGIDQQILTQMIDEQVALLEAEKHGITVSDEELAQQIFAIPGLQENGRFIGEERYEQLLRAQSPPMTKGEFEDTLRRSMMIDKLRAALTDWMAVADSDLEREYRQRNEKVKLQIVALTADRFRSQVTVTDADVASYFDSKKAEYRIGEQRTIKYLLLDRDQARQKVNVPETDIQRYYNDNIQQYQTPEQVHARHILLNTGGKDQAAVRKEAESILAQAKAPGADFAALATKFSEDEGSKAMGGDLGFFERGRMVPEFENAAFAMEPGQVSDLVQSQFGFHIIKVEEKRAATSQALDQVRPQIQQVLTMQLADQQITDRARTLDARLNTPADLDTVAKELGVTVQESGLFQREDPVPGLGAAPQISDTTFRLNDGEVSDALNSPRGPVFITVAQKKDPYVPMLDEVKDRVREDLIRSRATELSRQRASQIAAALKSAPNFTAAAKAQGLEAKDTELVAREAPLPDVGVSPEVDRVAFTLPAGGVSDPIETTDGTVIVKVVERDEVTPDEFRIGREAFRAELLNERRGRFFSAYMTKVKEKLTIEVKTDVLRRITSQQT